MGYAVRCEGSTSLLRTALLTGVIGALATTGPLRAQDTSVKLMGRCERLIIAGNDVSGDCKGELVNGVARGRTTFDFIANDGQLLSFHGAGAQREASDLTEQLQPISLVVAGRKESNAIVRNPAPAVGACRFSQPEPGKAMIDCEATSQGKTYAATFLTDAKPAYEDGKR